MGRYRVIVAPRAIAQVEQIAAWWQANRATAPDLFVEEFVAALKRLAVAPKSGAPYRRGPLSRLRRLLLPRTRHHVYYVTAEDVRRVSVLAVWHTARRGAPRL
jgi:plasmid stabilization system protein ParE